MNFDVCHIGTSQGIIIPQDVLKRMGVSPGDQLELSERVGLWFLKPVGGNAADQDDLERQLEAAAVVMEKYKVALKKLAE
ncbi:AbrB/MazE/SpoVT family DNA-binding domain-containing protein [Rhizobium sp. SAFR-030]|uniref:AbrB/MazE/SpoVT family DNA-binding domain-containing protein n=1 Tax=Rhizobium sp. SAFR-030 TaxID=3387277 RepID=UPI003F7E02BF